MTSNSSQELAHLLMELNGSLVDGVTIVPTFNEHPGEGQTETSDASGQIAADFINFLLIGVIGPLVCFVGLVGNFLSLITWVRPRMRGSTGLYLSGQAAANIGVLLTFLSCESVQCWFPTIKYTAAYGEFFSYVGFPMFYFSTICCVWFTVGVTVDRYIMVCWITKAKKLCSETRTSVSLILITVNGFLLNLPHFATFVPVYQDQTSHNFTQAGEPKIAFVASEFGSGQSVDIFDFWIHCMIMTVIPWFTILFMNVMIVFKLKKANKMMAEKKSSEAKVKSKKSENQITRLLLYVTFTFLLTESIQCVSHCLWVKKPAGANWLMIYASNAFGKSGILLNSTLNFVLYCMTGKRFRTELLKMFGLAKKDGSLSSSGRSSSNAVSTASTTTTTAAA